VKVTDPDGVDWVLGWDLDVFFLEVPGRPGKEPARDEGDRGEIPGILKVGDKIQMGRGGGVFDVVGIKPAEDGQFELAWRCPAIGVSPERITRDIVCVVGKGKLEEVKLGFEIIVNPGLATPAKKSKRKEAYADAT
jgi:hypothetical protein